MTKTVYIVGGDYLIANMFLKNRVKLTEDMDEADFLCFTGGHDVSPELYGETVHHTTRSSKFRDDIEQKVYSEGITRMIPMVGICRGGQFLNVMNGGKMYQDVNHHTTSHFLLDHAEQRKVFVTSTHHQMMRPCLKPPGANTAPIIVATADIATRKETATEVFDYYQRKIDEPDYEVLFYPDTECLCFQPHPEYDSPTTRTYFFQLLERYEIL